MDSELFRIEELQVIVVGAMRASGLGAPTSARIREVPDTRTIRYYTTIGLLDRPKELRGRTAYYSRRHVMQVVAIKRLQVAGKTLVQIQEQLVGITPRRLSSLANIPEAFWRSAWLDRAIQKSKSTFANEARGSEQTPEVGGKPIAQEGNSADQEDCDTDHFWKSPVAFESEVSNSKGGVLPIRSSLQLNLDRGVTLSIECESTEAVPTIDTHALQKSAQLLLQELARQGLISGAARTHRSLEP